MEYPPDRLRQAIAEQKLVNRDAELTDEFAGAGTQLELRPGEVVYNESDSMRGVFFILRGEVSLSRGGNILRTLGDTEEFGVWPLVFADPAYHVTATATVPTLVLHVAEQPFRLIAEKHSVIWKNMVRRQAEQLLFQNQLLLPTNQPMKMFVGSSTEGLDFARTLRDNLVPERKCLNVVVWDELFRNMEYPLEALTDGLDEWDFGTFLWTPDDFGQSRNQWEPFPRDNVVLEAGLSIGRLGRDRTFILVPRVGQSFQGPSGRFISWFGRRSTGRPQVKIPSDLRQIALVEYRVDDLAAAAERIRQEVVRLGPRTRLRYPVTIESR